MQVSGKHQSFVSLSPATSRNKTEMGSLCILGFRGVHISLKLHIFVTFVCKRWMLSTRGANSPFTAALSTKLDGE